MDLYGFVLLSQKKMNSFFIRSYSWQYLKEPKANKKTKKLEPKLAKEQTEFLWCAAWPVSADPGPAVIVRLCPGSDCCDAQRSDGYKRTVKAHFHMGNWSRRADKQREAAKCETSKLSQRVWEDECVEVHLQPQQPHPSWPSHFFPSILSSYQRSSLSQPPPPHTHPPTPPPPPPPHHTPTNHPTHTHIIITPQSIQTDTHHHFCTSLTPPPPTPPEHTYSSTPPVNQRAGCHAVSVGEKGKGKMAGKVSISHFITLSGWWHKKGKEKKAWGRQTRRSYK